MTSAYRTRWACLASTLAFVLLATTAGGQEENAGKSLLDEATEAKLTASSPQDLKNVIEKLEEAIEKGLDDESKQFAENLLAGTLGQRAEIISQLIFQRTPPDPRWPQIRQLCVLDLERALKLKNDLPNAHFLLGRLYTLPGGNREKALKSFTQVIDSKDEELSDLLRARAYVYRGALQPDNDKRLVDLNAAVKLADSNAEILRARALFFLRADRAKDALTDIEKVIELNPEHAASHELKGVALMMLKQEDDARASFEKAVELAPDDASPYENLANLLVREKRIDDALAALDKAIEIDSNSFAARLLRAQLLIGADRRDDAMDELEELLTLQPNNVQAALLKAELLRVAEKLDEAISFLREKVDASEQVTNLVGQLALYEVFSKQYRPAIEHFSMVLEKNPNHVSALRGRSDTYLSVGEHAKAIADYEKLLELDPDNATVLNNYAWVLCTSPKDELRNAEKAIELAKRACEVTEYKAAHILSTLAAAYAESGDFEKAREWSSKAIELGEKDAQEEQEPGPATEQLEQLKKELASYKDEEPWRELQELDKEQQPAEQNETEPELDLTPAQTSDF